MAKTVDIERLTNAAAGPKPPEPEYEFRTRRFNAKPKPPGQHEKKYDYTRR